MSVRFGSRARVRKAGIVGSLVAVFATLAVAAPSASAADITSSGPLTDIFVNQQLSCQITNGETQQFDSGVDGQVDNYCGTFTVTDDNVPGGTAIYGDPNAFSSIVDSGYAPVSNGPVSGSGTSADPFKLTTVVQIPAQETTAAVSPAQASTLLTITETETYVTGDSFYRTDITVHNDQDFAQQPTIYHAGDCALNGDDNGYAVDDTASSGAVFCTPNTRLQVNSKSVNTGNDTPGILGFLPISAGSHYLEDHGGEGNGPLFGAIDGSDFPDTCADCTLTPGESQPADNGSGLSWALDIPGGGSETRCFYTVNSFDNTVPDVPSGCSPVSNPPTLAQQPPPQCKLRISRARVFLFRRHPRLRLVARYRSADPADVEINFIAIEGGKKVDLGTVTRHFSRHGLFRLREELSQDQSDTLWQTHDFVVHFKIPGEPGFCERQYTKELTKPRIVDGQRVVFQSDSNFPQPGAGHPQG